MDSAGTAPLAGLGGVLAVGKNALLCRHLTNLAAIGGDLVGCAILDRRVVLLGPELVQRLVLVGAHFIGTLPKPDFASRDHAVVLEARVLSLGAFNNATGRSISIVTSGFSRIADASLPNLELWIRKASPVKVKLCAVM